MHFSTAATLLYDMMISNLEIHKINFSEDRKSFIVEFNNGRKEVFTDETEPYSSLSSLYKILKERQDITEVIFNTNKESFEIISTHGKQICFANEFKKINENKWEDLPIKNTTEEKKKLIDYIQLEAFRKIRQKANDITDESSTEEFAGYVHGIVDLEAELYSYIESNFKNLEEK